MLTELILFIYGPFFSPDAVNEKFFSVLKTLVNVLGSGDPCDELQKFKYGLKQLQFSSCLPQRPTETTVHHVGIVKNRCDHYLDYK